MKTSVPILNLTPKGIKEDEKPINNSPRLFKPLPIKIRKNENNIKYPISSITNDSKIPLIYPTQFQYGSFSNVNFNSSGQLRNFVFQEKNLTKKLPDNKIKPCCSCVKTKCIKKYCECYKEGLKCNIKCRCVKCLNCDEHSDKNNDNEKNICLDETRYDSGKKSICDEINEFNVQKIISLLLLFVRFFLFW